MAEVWNNATLTTRLKALEQAFYASRSREVDNTYRSEDALNKADALTPITYTKTAYVGDMQIFFEDVIDGNITVFAENTEGEHPNYTDVARQGKRVIVIFTNPLEYVTTITLSIS